MKWLRRVLGRQPDLDPAEAKTSDPNERAEVEREVGRLEERVRLIERKAKVIRREGSA